ncbi:MAG: dockerin type I repeat-containing protein [Oscillospiraceae bacterium]|nr:dockerin type I repeat-containing protein [Oscillospiraceae bacterium]
MKRISLKAALAALLTAIAAAPAIPANGSVSAQTSLAEEITLPSWVPNNFNTALDFRNYHGGTYISGNVLCVVFEIPPVYDNSDYARYTFDYSEDVLNLVSSEIYSADDTGEIDVTDMKLQVLVFKPKQTGEASVSLIDRKNGEHPICTYQFSVNEKLKIKETDLYAWVPDCQSEYLSFTKAHGNYDIVQNYLVFCLSAGAGTPYQWKEYLNHPELAERILESDCSTLDLVPRVGGTVQTVMVYRAKGEGELSLSWKLVSLISEDEEPLESFGGVCQVLDDGNTILQEGDFRVTLVDYDTGEKLVYPFDGGKNVLLQYACYKKNSETSPDPQPGDISGTKLMRVRPNPCSVPCSDLLNAEHYILYPDLETLPPGYSSPAVLRDGKSEPAGYFELNPISETNFDLVIKLKFTPDGDINGDGEFSEADLTALQQWLTADPKAYLKRWKAGDFINDDRLDARDLSAMKRALTGRTKEPGCRLTLTTEYGGTGEDGTDLGSGSFTTEYRVIQGDRFYENMHGRWFQNIRMLYNDSTYYLPILTVTEITEDHVTFVCEGYDGNMKELTVAYGDTLKHPCESCFQVCDGINYSYTVCFTDYSAGAAD